MFQISGVTGYFGGFLLYVYADSYTLFYVTATICGMLGAFILSRLVPMEEHRMRRTPEERQPPAQTSPVVGDVVKPVGGSTFEELASVARESSIWPLAPVLFWTGFELAYVTSSFTMIIAASDSSDDENHVEAAVLLVFTSWALCEVCGAVVFGRLSDTIGRLQVLFIGFLLYGAALALCAFFVHDIDRLNTMGGLSLGGINWMVYVTAGLFGLADCAVNTQVYALLGDMFPEENSSGAFVAFQFLQNIGGAMSYFLSASVSSTAYTLVIVQAAFLLLAAVCLAWFPKR
mmetsp:Transcript_52972/g.72345  ORF Transcript_52972/g.72345 Transcript_52972/m.72345 type:complete len:289 (-) Transcript_52972:709-1575(-)